MTELYMWIVVIFLLVAVIIGQLMMLSKFLQAPHIRDHERN